MDTSAVDSLINILSSSSTHIQLNDAIIDNIIYYTPRLSSHQQLHSLVSAFFNTPLFNDDPLRLVELTQSIFLWKLKISQPSLSLSDFISIWNNVLMSSIVNDKNNSSSTSRTSTNPVSKLAILSGILSTLNQYSTLQQQYFIDDANIGDKFYQNCKFNWFIPFWLRYFNNNTAISTSSTQNQLVLLFSVILSDDDINIINNSNIPWNKITLILIHLISNYVNRIDNENKVSQVDEIHKYNMFIHKHFSQIVKILQLSIPIMSSPQSLEFILVHLLRISGDINKNKFMTNNKNNNKINELNDHLSNIFLFIIFSLNGVLKNKIIINKLNSNQSDISFKKSALNCLFYTYFIALKFGIDDFKTYQDVYQYIISSLFFPNSRSYSNSVLSDITVLLKDWKYNISNDTQIYIRDSKLLFMLHFLQQILPKLQNINIQFIIEFIKPLEEQYLNNNNDNKNPNIDIIESTHMVILSLFANNISGADLFDWKYSRLLDYLSLCRTQYRSSILSNTQLLLIHKTIMEQMPLLITSFRNRQYRNSHIQSMQHNQNSKPIEANTANINNDFNILHRSLDETYSDILPRSSSDEKLILTQCLIYQIPYLDESDQIVWLTRCFELVQHQKRTTTNSIDSYCNDVILSLWDIISHGNSDRAIQWWYEWLLPQRDKL